MGNTREVTRDKLAKFLGNQELIRVFESLIADVSTGLPDTIAQIQESSDSGRALAGAAQAVAALALELAEGLAAAPASASLPLAASALATLDDMAKTPTQPLVFEAFPVGAVFTSTVSTDPSQLLGYGVWSAYAAGQVLVGYAAGDPDFGTPGGTGGAKTSPVSAHSGTAVATHPDHTHSVTSNVTATADAFTAGTQPGLNSITNNAVTSGGASIALSHTVTQPDTHANVNILQPYITVFFWLRTA